MKVRLLARRDDVNQTGHQEPGERGDTAGCFSDTKSSYFVLRVPGQVPRPQVNNWSYTNNNNISTAVFRAPEREVLEVPIVELLQKAEGIAHSSNALRAVIYL